MVFIGLNMVKLFLGVFVSSQKKNVLKSILNALGKNHKKNHTENELDMVKIAENGIKI